MMAYILPFVTNQQYPFRVLWVTSATEIAVKPAAPLSTLPIRYITHETFEQDAQRAIACKHDMFQRTLLIIDYLEQLTESQYNLLDQSIHQSRTITKKEETVSACFIASTSVHPCRFFHWLQLLTTHSLPTYESFSQMYISPESGRISEEGKQAFILAFAHLFLQTKPCTTTPNTLIVNTMPIKSGGSTRTTYKRTKQTKHTTKTTYKNPPSYKGSVSR
jgi:hypothetical protein